MNQQPEIRFPEHTSNDSGDAPAPEINLPGPDQVSGEIPVEFPERPRAGAGSALIS